MNWKIIIIKNIFIKMYGLKNKHTSALNIEKQQICTDLTWILVVYYHILIISLSP